MIKTVEDLLKKYRAYIANIEWHVNTNKPTGKELEQCVTSVTGFREMYSDLEQLQFTKPDTAAPTPADFLEYVKDERDNFCKAINSQEWDTELRTVAEKLLIAYDQMNSRLQTSDKIISGIEVTFNYL